MGLLPLSPKRQGTGSRAKIGKPRGIGGCFISRLISAIRPVPPASRGAWCDSLRKVCIVIMDPRRYLLLRPNCVANVDDAIGYGAIVSTRSPGGRFSIASRLRAQESRLENGKTAIGRFFHAETDDHLNDDLIRVQNCSSDASVAWRLHEVSTVSKESRDLYRPSDRPESPRRRVPRAKRPLHQEGPGEP